MATQTRPGINHGIRIQRDAADTLIHQTLDQPVARTTRSHAYTVKIEPVHSAPHRLISRVTIPPDRTVR